LEKLALYGGEPLIKHKIPMGPTIEDDDIEEVVKVLKSRLLSMLAGSYGKKFEEEFARKIGVKHAIAVANGSVALYVALKVCGIGPGDEVIVPSFTFTSTVTSVIYANAIPVFADIDLETYTIDPEDVRRKISDKTKAIIAVHLFGHPAEMDELREIADEKGLFLIEDSAQAIGAKYKGKYTGSLGDVAAFSLYATKNITAGEGGVVTTNDDVLAERARLIRSHGERLRYFSETLGFNFRMTEMQAALALSQLKKLERFNRERRIRAKKYLEVLEKYSDKIKLPTERKHAVSSWSIFEILLEKPKLANMRDEIFKAVKAEGAPIAIMYPRVIYEHPFMKNLVGHGKGCPWKCSFYYGKYVNHRNTRTPVAEEVSKKCLSLYTDPITPLEDVEAIANAIVKVIRYFDNNT